MSLHKLAPGPRPYPRIRLHPAFIAHVRAWMQARGGGLTGLCRVAFNGDDSGGPYHDACRLLSGGVFPNSLKVQTRCRALANATGWPAHEFVVEQLVAERNTEQLATEQIAMVQQ